MKNLKQCLRKQDFEVCKKCPCYTCEKDSCSGCNHYCSNYLNDSCPFEIEYPDLFNKKERTRL